MFNLRKCAFGTGNGEYYKKSEIETTKNSRIIFRIIVLVNTFDGQILQQMMEPQ